MNIRSFASTGILAATLGMTMASAAADGDAVGNHRATPASVDMSNCPRPAYPPEARRYEQAGTVTIGLFIGSDGTLKDSKVLVSSGFPLLDEAAYSAMVRCRLIPATRDGAPVESRIGVQFKWSLTDPVMVNPPLR
jgi:TonB family protein